jgi:FkbM family methyltransferase
MKTRLARIANRLYDHTPALHRALYSRYKQWSDRAERRFLAAALRPGMTVLDIGANIGIYTEFLAGMVGTTGQVIAFEPEVRNLARLSKATSALPQVRVVRAAVGRRRGHADALRGRQSQRRSPHLRCRRRDPPACGCACRLSRRFPASGRTAVDVVKMDIQGAELDALKGARRLLSQSVPLTMLLEYWPYGLSRSGAAPSAVIELLTSSGLLVRPLDPRQSLASLDPDNPEHYVNIVAVRG